MVYKFDSRVRFSEVDADGELKFNNFINYFQDCSTFQSEDLGLGVKYLRDKGLVWVVSSWQIEILKYPVLGDNITIGTFAYDFKSFLGYRNFFMTDENGEYIAKATSIWALLSTETGKPVKASEEDMKLYGKEEKLDMNYKPRKIEVPKDLKALDPIEVTHYHLDVNKHVNNGQYINIASSCVSGKEKPTSIRVEYRNQAHEGDIMYPFTDGNVVDLRDKDGGSYCVVDFS